MYDQLAEEDKRLKIGNKNENKKSNKFKIMGFKGGIHRKKGRKKAK